VWGKQGFLHRGLIIRRVKPMVSSSLLDEALYAVVSPIKVSNQCSGVNADGFESLGVYQGEMTGSAPNEDFSTGAWLSVLPS
jgi:hypothetical protein